jgi:hypothetical protein
VANKLFISQEASSDVIPANVENYIYLKTQDFGIRRDEAN